MAAVEPGKEQRVKVKVTSTAHVKPSKSIGRRECQLVTFDLPYLAFFYNQKLLLYKGGGDFGDAVGKLKDGLAAVLEEYYPLAGRLGKDDDGVFKVEYSDDLDGVEVSEAVADDGIGVDDLTAEDCPATLKDLFPYNGVSNVEGLHRPLLAVQVTKLRDGLTLGCAFNHAIIDGTSTWHFMSAWAHTCSGLRLHSPPAPPFLDRTKARSTRVQLDLPLRPADNNQANGDATPDPPPATTREKIFKFTEPQIDRMKSMVNADPSKPMISTFQSLSAHVWRAVTRARELKPEDITVCTIFADCRKRLHPPLPETYFGNLIQALFTGTAAGLLAAHPPDSTAAMIKKAIQAHDAAAIEARNAEWEANPIIFQYKDAGTNCIAIGSSPRFKVYDVDFGWGSPESVRSGLNNRFDGMVYLYQGKAGGRSIDLEISLEAGAMERLEKDPEFLLVDL